MATNSNSNTASNTRQIGAAFEQIACNHLRRLGYKIVARNVWYRWGEIDIVAMHNDVLIFVEVRSRRTARWGTAAESVMHVKRRRIIRAAETFLVGWQELGGPNTDCRFDIIDLTGNKLLHFEDAFRPGLPT